METDSCTVAKRLLLSAISICVVLLASGCCSNPYFGFPEFGPIDAQTQRRRAARFDPFPDPTIGPGASTCRPREYQDPTPFKNAPNRDWFNTRRSRIESAPGNNPAGQTCPRPVSPAVSPYNSYSSQINRNGYVRPDCEAPIYLPPKAPQASCPRQPTVCVPEGYRSCPNACL